MIQNKEDLKEYVKQDLYNSSLDKSLFRHPKLLFNRNRKYLILLRKNEYYINTKKRIRSFIYKTRLSKLSHKTLTYIPPNCFEAGLSISHLGCIYINGNTRGGKNCRLSQCVTIGSTNGNDLCPTLGNYVFVGPNANILGNIKIADGVAIGAGSVVVKDINEKSISVGGVPAKKISEKGSELNIRCLRERVTHEK